MPEVRDGGADFLARSTPVPNALLDGVMPALGDAELRVLLVVVRQTLGWQDGADWRTRKERDWLTQSQLMRRTGRGNQAVSRAVDALVRRGLIEVQDAAGAPRRTPAERRRCRGRLYYRLAALTPAPVGGVSSVVRM
jgi:DNA-binding MarR family transcriptional regulator